MPKIRTYCCPSCDGKFDFMHHPSDEPAPRFCPLCGYDVQSDEEMPAAVVSPRIAKPIGKIVDNTYQGMSDGADFRAQMAMEVHGLDADQANALKMTDMKDHLQYGEIAAVPVSNEITRTMEIGQQAGVNFGFQGNNGLGYSGTVSTGPSPNAGARAQKQLRQLHGNFLQSSGHHGATVTDTPALEMQNPLYKRRV
jgi:hypothetical protein